MSRSGMPYRRRRMQKLWLGKILRLDCLCLARSPNVSLCAHMLVLSR